MKRKIGLIGLSLIFLTLGSTGLGAAKKEKKAPAHGAQEKTEHKKGGEEVHWSYEGSGSPEQWGYLESKFAQCRKGDMQSPIDVSNTIDASLKKIRFSYKKSEVVFVNNGHTVQLNFQPGSTISANGSTYQLLQLHFHTSSEHAENGKLFPMEMHLVHINAQKQLAVVGVLFETGKINPALQVLWNKFPKEKGDENQLKRPFNAAVLLPKNRSYYHYKGSLTTPPCSEGVSWFLLSSKQLASSTQVKTFQSVFGETNRPVQPVGQRFVLRVK